MREGASNPSGRNPRVVWSSAILVIIGLSVLLTTGEWFATFDACAADPACNGSASPETLEIHLALMVVGVALTVVGVMLTLIRRRADSRRALIIWL